jgi:hypothetical protein
MIKHLVTSGCSFSDNYGKRWPHYLSKKLGCSLYNWGQGSCGNSWISKTAIHQIQKLLDNNINPTDILVSVMWSGIDRKELFISAKETYNYEDLINKGVDVSVNPVSFIDNLPNDSNNHASLSGYLIGSMNCSFVNTKISKFKQDLISKYFNDEALAIESYENFLRLQWYCSSKGIKLINQTYMDIIHYPNREKNTLTRDYYKNIKPLYDMIDFSKWVFWDDTGGLYEYTRDNNLGFYTDNTHPLSESHNYYVDNFLIKELGKKLLLTF